MIETATICSVVSTPEYELRSTIQSAYPVITPFDNPSYQVPGLHSLPPPFLHLRRYTLYLLLSGVAECLADPLLLDYLKA
ncbi:MAG: hypothetical protein JWM42_421 [Burkholderia sp.]|nr:hypothetical protein [Burkholderia sp.]